MSVLYFVLTLILFLPCDRGTIVAQSLDEVYVEEIDNLTFLQGDIDKEHGCPHE